MEDLKKRMTECNQGMLPDGQSLSLGASICRWHGSVVSIPTLYSLWSGITSEPECLLAVLI
jgi:hypothetical protein